MTLRKAFGKCYNWLKLRVTPYLRPLILVGAIILNSILPASMLGIAPLFLLIVMGLDVNDLGIFAIAMIIGQMVGKGLVAYIPYFDPNIALLVEIGVPIFTVWIIYKFIKKQAQSI